MEKENESPLLIALRGWHDNEEEEEEDDLCKAPFTLEKVESSNIESSKKGVFSLAGGSLMHASSPSSTLHLSVEF